MHSTDYISDIYEYTNIDIHAVKSMKRRGHEFGGECAGSTKDFVGRNEKGEM